MPAQTSAGIEITDATLIPLPKLSASQIQELINDIVNQYRLVAGFRKQDAKTAGIIAPLFNVGALAGFKAEQILLGKTTPHKTPIQVLSNFSFIVNMPTAREFMRG